MEDLIDGILQEAYEELIVGALDGVKLCREYCRFLDLHYHQHCIFDTDILVRASMELCQLIIHTSPQSECLMRRVFEFVDLLANSTQLHISLPQD